MKLKNIFALSLLLSLAALCACSSDDKKAEKADEKPTVKVAEVEQRSVEQKGVYTASVEAEVLNNISSSMPLRIKSIAVDEGMRVSAGQTLVVLDDVNSHTYQMQVDNARANLKNVQLNYDRALELYKIGGGTKQNVDQMEVQLVNAKNALKTAERTLRNAAENTVLKSPISGVVTKRNYDPGDMTGALPVLTVAKVSPVKVVINVPETEFSKVKKGMHASITFDTYGDAEFPGVVTMISPTVDAQSRTFGVEVTMPNPDSRVLPGMFGRVTLNLGDEMRAVVPDRAVVKMPGAGAYYVYVYKDGKVEYKKVELGQRINDAYEIISGVEPGEQVVVVGQNKLANGKEVKLAK